MTFILVIIGMTIRSCDFWLRRGALISSWCPTVDWNVWLLIWNFLLLLDLFLITVVLSYWTFGTSILLLFFIIIIIIVTPLVFLTLLDTLAHTTAILLIVLAEHDGSGVIGWWIHIWIGEQRLDWCEDWADIVYWWPHVLQNVKADGAVRVNVRVEHLC